MIKIDLQHSLQEVDFSFYQDHLADIHTMIHEKTGKGNDFLGWVDWPIHYDQEEFERIKVAAKRIRQQADVLLVCGIGGSYLGAKAAIDMINGPYSKDSLEIVYVGNTFSSTQLLRVLDYVKDKELACNVISKSGRTTETALAFRMVRQLMEEKYGKEETIKRTYVTTDREGGLLRPLVDKYQYESFVIPGDIGGRYSVLTAVGLLPMAAAGIDIDEVMAGAKRAYETLNNPDLLTNEAYQIAVMRRVLEQSGKNVELFVTYEPHMLAFIEWIKQLYGESEGKEGKGLLPHGMVNSTDLHSIGQFVQEGTKCLFETLISVRNPLEDALFPTDDLNEDEMNYLAGKSLHWVNQQAQLGTLQAHVEEGEVPNLILELYDNSAKTFGYAVYFFFITLAASAYMLDVNPFDQPGVEVYKKNMFKLLGKE
ncbi:MAG TPA: glucose-6-phosphate isomerase [Erysipelothrix sp.]|nr:glucose-6-phosphate isomerase [Erysipelothrix sp.]